MKKSIHHQNWNLLTGQQIVDLFDYTFGSSMKDATDGSGTTVTIAPNMDMVLQLKAMEAATLELLENRTGSTVYRIRQTGVVYQLCQPDGELFEFDDYFDYQQAEPVDELLTEYESKPLIFTAEETDGELWITHHEPPPFRARWIGGMEGVTDLEFTEGEPTQQQMLSLAKVMRKLGAFVNSYFKK